MTDQAKADEITNIIAEMESRNTADVTYVTDQIPGKEGTTRQRIRREETHRDVTEQGTSTDIRSIRGGIEKRHNGLTLGASDGWWASGRHGLNTRHAG